MKAETRVLLAKAVCWLLSATVGWQLLHMPQQVPVPSVIPKVSKKVRLAAPQKKVVAASREQVLIRTVKPPKEKVASKKVVVPPKVEPPLTIPEPEPIVIAEAPNPALKLVLEQPGLEAPPPAPPDDLPRPTQFDDKPYGSVLVLAVQLNSDNVVVLTDILVPSNRPMSDLAFALTTRNQKWKNVEPPIPPGHFRWVELRLDYSTINQESSVLP